MWLMKTQVEYKNKHTENIFDWNFLYRGFGALMAKVVLDFILCPPAYDQTHELHQYFS